MKQKQLTIVIKLGTSSICDETTHEPRIANMSLIVETVVALRRAGHRVIIVSSAAIAMGLKRMNIARRPKHLATVQALAAVGQCRLIALWDDLFGQLNQPVAQLLLTRTDIVDRSQYLNAANTITELLTMGVIPIVNENDTLSVTEIKFGDNDTLSAITAGMANADYLFLMTDVDSLYTGNPRLDPAATPIEVVTDISALKVDVSTAGSSVGTGGMVTKLIAAELATSAGITTIITRSNVPGNIHAIIEYLQALEDGSAAGHTAPQHTRFLPRTETINDRHFWILHGLKAHGTVYIDQGAYKALTRVDRAGLLPAGVVAVTGSFNATEAVALVVVDRADVDAHGLDPAKTYTPVGHAIVNYSSVEISRIKGRKSSEIAPLLGYADSEYVAHRDNLAFFPRNC
ncbi:Aspartate/glutamate/uridylate kinase [Dipodascopsis tothii]|uniref:Aspartate/glutamate/uridylate kinase n=1 Tax=Dipodascopsis tothii TaxID=44089 RepID=UPI0034CF5E45